MNRSELLEKLLIVHEGNKYVFEKIYNIRKEIDEYEATVYKYEFSFLYSSIIRILK